MIEAAWWTARTLCLTTVRVCSCATNLTRSGWVVIDVTPPGWTAMTRKGVVAEHTMGAELAGGGWISVCVHGAYRAVGAVHSKARILARGT